MHTSISLFEPYLAATPETAMAQASEQLCDAARSGDCARLRDLVASGADVSHFDGDGMTPLMNASKHGHVDAVGFLLEAGAPWNALTPTGLSAGDFAMQNCRQDAFDLLLNAGIQAELVLGTIARRSGGGGSNSEYLEERVLFGEDRVMDSESKAVMMAWEKPLMEAHARAICGAGRARILNVGFGMGLVDAAIQRYSPASHTIVEAHPDVYKRMIESGWGEKENVKIVFGRWQDVLPQLESYDGKLGKKTGNSCPFCVRGISSVKFPSFV